MSVSRQVPKNLAMNVVSFICSMLIGLWLVPYLVGHLGVAAYGLVPLAMIFSEYVGFIVQSINSAINRFLLIAIRKESHSESLEVFNSSLFLVFGLILLQVPLCILILFNLESLIDVPDGLLVDSLWLFGFTFGGFLLSLLSAVFSVSMFSNNRLDLMRACDVLRLLTRVIVVISLFAVKGPALCWVGLANLVASIVFLIMTVWQWARLTPGLRISLSHFRWGRVSALASMGGWVTLGQVGYLLFVRTDVWLISKFIGAEGAGQYAAVLQWSTMIRSIGGVLAGVAAPLIAIYYAKSEFVRMGEVAVLSVKAMVFGLSLIVCVLCLFSEFLLSSWLGQEYSHLWPLFVAQVSHLGLNAGVLPLFSVNTAMNRVKWPGLVSLGCAITHFCGSLWILRSGGGMLAVAILGASLLILKNGFFGVVYGAKLLGVKFRLLLREIWLPIASVTLFVGASYLVVTQFLKLNGWAAFGLTSCFGLLGVLPLALWLLGNGYGGQMVREWVGDRWNTKRA